jgi:hypothetical protein
VQLAEGWGGVEARLNIPGRYVPAAAPKMSKAGAYAPPPQSAGRAKRRSRGRGNYSEGSARVSMSRESVAMPDRFAAPAAGAGGGAGASDADQSVLDEIAPRPDGLYGLLSLQSADGSFGWDDRAEDLWHLWEGARPGSRKTVEEKLKAVDAASRERAVNTVLVLLLLAQRFADRERLWRRAHRKACRQFLEKALGQEPAQVEAWLKQVAAAL